MKLKTIILILFFLVITSGKSMAQSLDQYRWTSRIVLVFSPTPNNALFKEQVALLKAAVDDFKDRDVIFIFSNGREAVSTNTYSPLPVQTGNYHTAFKVDIDQFELILIGLDGTEKYRSGPKLTPPKDLMGLIDSMPMRRQELRERKRKGKR